MYCPPRHCSHFVSSTGLVLVLTHSRLIGGQSFLGSFPGKVNLYIEVLKICKMYFPNSALMLELFSPANLSVDLEKAYAFATMSFPFYHQFLDQLSYMEDVVMKISSFV